MNQTQLYRLVDRAVSGRLGEILMQYRDLRLTPSRMALRLAAEHQVEVSAPTIKKWVDALPHEDPRRAGPSPQTVCGAQPAQTPRNAKPVSPAQTEVSEQKAVTRMAVAS